jgi:DNA helicase-2/ATP-dependent DNA helicase PcrA
VRTAWGVPNEFPPSRFLDDLPEELLDWRRRESSTDRLRGPGGFLGGRSGGYGSGRSGGRSDDGFRGGRPARSSSPAPSSGGATFGSATPRPDAAIPTLAVGDRVTHDAYGLGTVVAVEGGGHNAVAKVDFGTEGTKRLLLRFSPVTKL